MKTPMRHRNIHLAIKSQLLAHNLIIAPAVRARQNLFCYVIRCFSDHFRDRLRLDRLLAGRALDIVLPRISFGQRLFFIQEKLFLYTGFVVAKRRHLDREKFSISVYPPLLIDIRHGIHVFDNLWHECLIFLLGILLIQNTIVAVSQSNASEKIFSIVTMLRVAHVLALYGKQAKKISARMINNISLETLGKLARHGKVAGIFRATAIIKIAAVFSCVEIESVFYIFAIEKIFSATVETLNSARVAARIWHDKCLKLPSGALGPFPGIETILVRNLFIFFFRIFHILETIFFAAKPDAHKTI